MVQTKVWGDYEIHVDQVLGRGGMGAVYRGRQISVDRPVAIKVLKKELATPDFIKRFQREAALLARLVDAHIVQIFGAGEAEGEHFFAMEFVEGIDLASQIKSGKRFTVEEVLDIAIQTGLALKAAWKFKIVHRDIKPSNIIVTRDKQVKMMDFGLAKNPDMDLTRTELIMGTAKYISPEQATGGEVDIRADMYSLGIVLYELATGSVPFVGDSPTSVIYQHVHKAPAPPNKLNGAVPEPLSAFILRCLAKKPEDRYQTPEDLIADAKAIQEGVSINERTILFAQTQASRSSAQTVPMEGHDDKTVIAGDREAEAPNHRGLWLSLAMAALLLGVGGFFLWRALGRVNPNVAKTPGATGKNGGKTQGTTNGSHTTDPPIKDSTTKDPQRDEIEENYKAAATLFNDEKWPTALDALDKLLAQLPEGHARQVEVKAMVQRCKFEQAVKAGNDAGSREAQIKEYERALGFLPPDHKRRRAVEGMLLELRYKKYEGEAIQLMEESDWKRAAEAWNRACENAIEDKMEYAESRRLFCVRFQDGINLLRDRKDFAEAKIVFEGLLKTPCGQEVKLKNLIRECEEELAARAKMAVEETKRRFTEEVTRGREAFERGEWGIARESLERAAAMNLTDVPPDFPRLLRRARAAASPPQGMVYVPAITFTLGKGSATAVEGPEQSVELSAYYMDIREVTKGEYKKFLDEFTGHAQCHPSETADKKQGGHTPLLWKATDLNEPVTGVDWFDAYAYAAWAGKRLPTEAEMERAGGTELLRPARHVYPWGDDYGRGDGPTAVGVEGFGNNVLEWTADWFDAYRGGTARNRDFGTKNRSVRGGYLLNAREETRVTARKAYSPESRKSFLGFRCVKTVEE